MPRSPFRTVCLAAPILALPALAACKVYDPLYCDENTECTNSERPFCDLGGDYPASEGVPRTCIPDPNAGGDADGEDGGEPDAGQEPVACASPGETLACEDDTLVRCNDDRIEERTECPMGCSAEDLRCLDLDPSNDLADYLDQAAAADPLILTGVARFDTDSGNLHNGDKTDVFVQTTLIDAPEDGVAVRVVVASRVAIENLSVSGFAALAIVSDGLVLIDGRLSVDADDRFRGPGGVSDPSNCQGQRGIIGKANGHFHRGGSGGGGHRTAGAPGGTVDGAGENGDGGGRVTNSGLVPLRGGCPGGGSDNGGGAVQIVSRVRIEISETGIVNANGGSGIEPLPGTDNPDPGGGGGAGGGILLEAPSVIVDGGLFANGGGGSAACGTGDNGRESLQPALGRQCPGSPSGDGGSGGSALDGPTEGESIQPGTQFDTSAGSGGGSAGFIRINTRHGTFVPGTTALISPSASAGATATR